MEPGLEQLNRQALIAAQRQTGAFAWTTVLLVTVVVSGAIATLVAFAHGMLPLWAAILLMGAFTYASYTPVHEAAHGNIHGRNSHLAWFGDLCGHLCAPLIFLPHTTHRIEHIDHHRYTNDAQRDPDYHIRAMADGLLPALLAPWRLLGIHISYIFRRHWHTQASRREKLTYFGEVGLALGWRALFLTQVPLLPGLAVVLGGYALGAYFTVYWFAYRPHYPYDRKGRYVDTCSMIVPFWAKPFEWIWLGQNLHSIHHAFPRVPFYRYHRVYREIEPVLRAHGNRRVDVFTHRLLST